MLRRICKLLRYQEPIPEENGLLMSHGKVVSIDGTPGYMKSCLFQHTDTEGNDNLYVNTGDNNSCKFRVILSYCAH